jgi:hypothetical protein
MSESGTNDWDDGIPDNSSNRFDDQGSVNSWADLNDDDYSTDGQFAGNTFIPSFSFGLDLFDLLFS